MVSLHFVVLGATLAGVRAARRLAAAGLTITLLEPTPFLGSDVSRSSASWMPAVPDLLEAMRDPRITVLTQVTVDEVVRQGDGFRLQLEQAPRYVDQTRCTGCGECEEVCPVEPLYGQNGRRRKAIYRDPSARAVPNVFVVEKRGVPPCTFTCPGGIHVQGYVALIAQGKFRQAHNLITRAIPFPGICGRVCFHPCEGECSRNELDEPIAVRALKRFVADHVAERDGLHWERPTLDQALAPVAVVGSGPAGLTVAWELARAGARVTVFEALPVAGGMMAVGIPSYRLPREVLRREIQAIEELGVEFRLNTPVGVDGGPSLEDLRNEYGAIFLGMGAHRSRQLLVPGEDLTGVVHGTDLLREVCLAQVEGAKDLPDHLRQAFGVELGRRAIVVGGGNTAVDVARTLRRLRVEQIRILYRRSRREMPAIPEEVTAAEEEGIALDVLATPVRFLGQDGRLTAVECVRMELGEPDESGRHRPVPIPGTEFLLEADLAVLAVGQEPDLPILPAKLCDDDGRLCVDEGTGLTALEGVFAAGDVVRVASVIEAVGAGKQVASTILRYLRGQDEQAPVPFERPVARWSREELEGWVHRARQEPPLLPARRRGKGFAEVEHAFTAEQAVVEASRCLACATCSECLECVAVCEPQAIDHDQRPRRFNLEADGVLLAGGYDVAFPEGVYHLSEAEASRSMETLLGGLPTREGFAIPKRGRAQPVASVPARVGVFLCRCGGQLSDALDLDALQERLSGLPGVAHVEQVPFACLPEGIAALREATVGLDGAVLAACSCCNLAQTCYSCTTQRVRCRAGLGVWEDEETSALPPWAWEYLNLREHNAWVRRPGEALEAAMDAITAALARLTVGPIVPAVASVDPARCRACGTCQALCQAEAIRLEADEQGHTRAHVDEGRCLACGTCAAHCPTGAVVAGRVSDRQLEATVGALVRSGQGDRVVVFACNWGGHSGVEAAGMRHQALPAGVRMVRVPCLGRLSAGLLLRALEEGAAGVLLAGCQEIPSEEGRKDGCFYEFGREMAAAVLSQAQALADLLGLGAERLGMVGVAPGDDRSFLRHLAQFAAQVRGVPAPSRE